MLPRESDMPVVVKIIGELKPEGAKGHYYKNKFQKGKKPDRIDSN
jgi:hypothetical protein